MRETPEPIVEAIMSSPVLTVGPGDPIARVAKVMVDGGVGSVVVKEGKRVVGIITERDILRWLQQGQLAQVVARDIMSHPVITAEPGTHCAEALETMVEEGIRRLPVVDDEGNLVGIVTERDIMGWLLDNPDEFSTLLPEADPRVVRDALLAAAQELHRRGPGGEE